MSQYNIQGDWSDSVIFSTDQGGKCFIVFKHSNLKFNILFDKIIFCNKHITHVCSNFNDLNPNK